MTTDQLAKLLEWLHELDVETLRQVANAVEAVLAEFEHRSANRPEPQATTNDDETPKAEGPTLTEDSIMPFGKHQGTLLRDVPPHYLAWLWTQRPLKKNPELERYLEQLFNAPKI